MSVAKLPHLGSHATSYVSHVVAHDSHGSHGKSLFDLGIELSVGIGGVLSRVSSAPLQKGAGGSYVESASIDKGVCFSSVGSASP